MIEMKQINDKVFIDTNILIYAYSLDEKEKRDVVRAIIENSQTNVVISTQVVNEFINVMRKKMAVSLMDLQIAVDELSQLGFVSLIDMGTISQALSISKLFKYAYFDSLIIASALENSCKILYSEDMQHGQVLEKKLTILNPYLSCDPKKPSC